MTPVCKALPCWLFGRWIVGRAGPTAWSITSLGNLGVSLAARGSCPHCGVARACNFRERRPVEGYLRPLTPRSDPPRARRPGLDGLSPGLGTQLGEPWAERRRLVACRVRAKTARWRRGSREGWVTGGLLSREI